MLKIRFPSKYNQRAGVNRLLIKYGSGLTLTDKLSFSVLKISYLGLWLITYLIPREKKRKNKFYKIEFRDLMSKFVGPKNMIECEIPKYGYKSYCRTDNSFNDLIIMTKHEDDLLQLFRPTKGDTVVDVGAYLGRYTLTSSNLVGENGKVIAIEGDPSHYEMLNKNLKLNKVSNVTAISCMVGSKDMHLIVGSEGNYLTVSSKDIHTNYEDDSYKEFDETGRAQIGNTIVNLNTLDNLLIQQHGINEVNWMKIDVEGAELEVLKGAHDILSNSKRINLLIEIHDVNKLYKPIVEILNSHNFKIIFEKDEQRYTSGAKHIIAKKLINE